MEQIRLYMSRYTGISSVWFWFIMVVTHEPSV